MELPDRLDELYKTLRQNLRSAGIPNADRDARLIINNHTQFEWADIMARGDERIAANVLMLIEADTERRLAGEPVSRIYGERSFWGLDFKICDDTLDPRPDTETIIDAALNHFRDKPPESVLDLGTGSGCIIIALLSEWKEARGLAIDLSLNVIKTAKANAERNNVADRLLSYCGSWGRAVNKKFDLIVSNPPYIPNQIIPSLSKEVRNHDPILALDGGPDGLNAYRSILTEMPHLLKADGIALLEIGYNQQEDVVRLVGESGFSIRGVHHDLAGLPRVVEITRGDN